MNNLIIATKTPSINCSAGNNICKTNEMGGCPLALGCHLHAKLLFVFMYHVGMESSLCLSSSEQCSVMCNVVDFTCSESVKSDSLFNSFNLSVKNCTKRSTSL